MYSQIDKNSLDKYMKNKIIKINVDLNLGKCKKKVWSCDLTHDYVTINADYRS